MLSFSPMIGFRCICARRDFRPIGNQSYNHQGMGQILERIDDNAYKVDLPGEYDVSATFNVYDFTLFDVGDDSRSNPFEERGMMRISPTPSVIMPTTHWRCQLGQSQELGQRSLKKH